MRVGDVEFEIVSGGAFMLDGGGMFGVIPLALWSKLYKPDERGRIQLDTNCLLVRTGDELILIDTGNGSKLTAKEQAIFDLTPGNPLIENLQDRGVAPEDVTMVLLTHLHMDHVGGASHVQGDTVVATFPNARYVVQRREWEDALHNRSHMRVSYRLENLEPLRGNLVLLDGDTEVAPRVSVHVTGGHTRAHQSIFLRSQGETAWYTGDICPTPAHFRLPYNMAFDMEPYETMLAKQELLTRAAHENWLTIFDHEPDQKIVRVVQDGTQFHPSPLTAR